MGRRAEACRTLRGTGARRAPQTHIARGLAIVTLAWSRFDSGMAPGLAYPSPDRPMFLGVPHELAGLDAAFEKQWPTAHAELATAARLWAPYHLRGELRCEWAAAEMLRRAGEVGQAITALTMLEKRCADIGQVPIAAPGPAFAARRG